MAKFNFSYDKENDDLFLSSQKSKSKGSVEFGDLIIDFNSKKEFVGIQIMNASKFIKDLLEGTDSASIKHLLENLESVNIDVRVKNTILIIRLDLNSRKEEISPILTIPSIGETSPSLAYA